MAIKDLPEPSDHEQRIQVARNLAIWELGNRGWADRLISAYFHPEATQEYLDREMRDG